MTEINILNYLSHFCIFYFGITNIALCAGNFAFSGGIKRLTLPLSPSCVKP